MIHFSVEQLANRSKLKTIKPDYKVLFSCVMLLISVVSPYQVGLLIMLCLSGLTVYVGKIKWDYYLSMLAVPLSFLLLSSLALLIEYGATMEGLVGIGFFGGYFYVSQYSLTRCILVTSRAMGAVSALYFLNLSTSMFEIIGVMRKMKVPNLIIELMYLMYRYVFILLETYSQMHASAKSRSGYMGIGQSIKTTGTLWANLLGNSYKKANACFDALESRCYDGDINFLE